jgi:hypothetical protein
MKLLFAIVGFLALLAYSAALPFNPELVGNDIGGKVSDINMETRGRNKRCWAADDGSQIPNVQGV